MLFRSHHRAALTVQSILIPLFDATSERERIALIHFRRMYFDEFRLSTVWLENRLLGTLVT